MVLVQQFDTDLDLAIGALLANGVAKVASSIDTSRENGFRIVKSRIFVTMTGKTTAEGPIFFGVALNFESASAIALALLADPTLRTSDISRGKATYIQILQKVGLVPTVFPSSDEGVGKMFEISYGKNGWSIPEGAEWAFFAFNTDASTLTTGTAFQVTCEHFGVWLRD